MDQGLIFGAGQAGSYLAELLLEKKYKVVLATRRSATGTRWRLDKCINNPNFTLIECDVTDCANVFSVISKYKPDEIYNTACQSHVKTSFDEPMHTFDATGKSQLNVLEAIKQTSPESKCLFYSSSETFGNSYSTRYFGRPDDDSEIEKFQDESTPFSPTSPYSISKLAAYNFTKLYREAYGLKTYSSIFFNMESPRRGINFVTRKITSYFHPSNFFRSDYPPGKLKLGNLKAYRDWSYVPDSIYGGWLVLQQDSPKEYVFSSEETHSIEEFLDEVGKYHKLNWKEYVEIDPSLFRPSEVNYLCGNSTKAKNELGWESKVKFKELVQIMCEKENGKT